MITGISGFLKQKKTLQNSSDAQPQWQRPKVLTKKGLTLCGVAYLNISLQNRSFVRSVDVSESAMFTEKSSTNPSACSSPGPSTCWLTGVCSLSPLGELENCVVVWYTFWGTLKEPSLSCLYAELVRKFLMFALTTVLNQSIACLLDEVCVCQHVC